ncbi:hypothetical protein QBC41DRAFT_329015 [Cercophora samala]|uniref:Alternative oxidase n=1 Tax=Cercophora samala TaxID=330535 RepID=A0AA39Z4E5_9PEZI|nr:hypothetical protein QBC41DRAFT_329015 [Cercophora samala]
MKTKMGLVSPVMSPSLVSRPRGVLFLVCLISLVTIWSCRLPKICLYESTYRSSTSPHQQPKPNSVDLSHPDSPFVGWPLQRVCGEQTSWKPGLVFICDNNSGGIGNIRNYILTCVRYGIEAGATGIVLPRIRTRSEKNLADLMLDYQPFTYFFDEHHFRTNLQAACPKVTVYDDDESIPNVQLPVKAEKVRPHDLGKRGGCDKRDLNKHVGVFDKAFGAYLERTEQEFGWPQLNEMNPRPVRFPWGVQFEWPTWKDGPEFTATFGGLLKFREDILALGFRAKGYMREFAKTHGGNGRYVGLHLRTESDALSRWPDFGNQTEAYLTRAEPTGINAAYLATGNKTDAARLVQEAARRSGMGVITKHDLLAKYSREDLLMLEALTWDQQALIDFVVLVESDYFFGVSPSSFSLNVALKRHLKTEGLYTRPWKIGGDGDGRSWLTGRFEQYWDDWLYMYESMWP